MSREQHATELGRIRSAHEQEMRRILVSFETEKREIEAEAMRSVRGGESVEADIRRRLEVERDNEVKICQLLVSESNAVS